MNTKKDCVIIQVDPGVKASWVRASQSESMKLNDWVMAAILKAHPGLVEHESSPPPDRMTLKQFDVITTMIGMEKGPAYGAARMILVDGLEIREALSLSGASEEEARRAVHLATYNLTLAKSAALRP